LYEDLAYSELGVPVIGSALNVQADSPLAGPGNPNRPDFPAVEPASYPAAANLDRQRIPVDRVVPRPSAERRSEPPIALVLPGSLGLQDRLGRMALDSVKLALQRGVLNQKIVDEKLPADWSGTAPA